MSDLDKLVALGAQSCAGSLIFKNKVVGTLTGGFTLTQDGRELLEREAGITDLEVKSETPKRGRKPKAEAEAEPEVQASADGVIDI